MSSSAERALGWKAAAPAPSDKFNDWGGGGGCNIFVPVLGGKGTKIAPIGNMFDQPPGQMRRIWGKIADHIGDPVVSSPEGAVLVTSPGTKSSYPHPPQWLTPSSAGGEKRKAAQPSGAAKAKAKKSKNTSRVGFTLVMGVHGGVVWRYLPPQRVPVRPRQRHHLHGRPCRTRHRTRSASTAAADSAADPATTAATSTAAPAAAAAAAGGRGRRSSAAKRGQLQQDGWRR